jgi:hypothetical protein
MSGSSSEGATQVQVSVFLSPKSRRWRQRREHAVVFRNRQSVAVRIQFTDPKLVVDGHVGAEELLPVFSSINDVFPFAKLVITSYSN